MNKDVNYVKQLVSKFFDGRTTNAEEKELSRYFSQESVADELKEYVAFFNYMAGDFILELKNVSSPIPAVIASKKRRKVWYIVISSVAAILIAVVMICQNTGFDPYEGSYMIVNGKKIYDRELIKEQEREIRIMFAARSKEYNEMFKRIELHTNE